jgi:hypothetical protein
MIFFWLFAGCLFVSVPFYLFYDPYTLWPALYASGILVSDDVCDRSIPVFAAYHSQRGEKKNIVPLFAEMYAGKIKDGFFPSVFSENDCTKRYVRYQGDTAVVLISVDTVAQGIRPGYRKINGSTGRLQMTTTLTALGVRYERFRNADGDSGKIQCSIIMHPSTHTYEIQQNN